MCVCVCVCVCVVGTVPAAGSGVAFICARISLGKEGADHTAHAQPGRLPEKCMPCAHSQTDRVASCGSSRLAASCTS